MLHIEFERGHNGTVKYAKVLTPKGELFVSGAYVRGTRKDGTPLYMDSSDGVVYNLLNQLKDWGYEGEPFDASDGRLVCLEGFVGKNKEEEP